ncbi:MAG: RiPP maturation radical SAM protein 1 [Thermodesulfobacteria bacterium]|nr:RiPP maturation radical SAM protein 1 [Thermodesulfobacteriota bacterium]
MKLALLALPWPLFNRPSVQLGVLKGYLRSVWPELEVKTYHPYLKAAHDLGFELYHEISQSSWLSEALSFAMLYPEMAEKAAKLARKEARRRGLSFSFEKTLTTLKRSLEDYLASLPWEEFRAVGLSVCLNQLGASLWAARWIKARFPDLPLILGGSSCAEDLGRSLLSTFPWVDFVVNGEGERPLRLLLRHLFLGEAFPEAGVFYRQNGEISGGGTLELPPAELPSPLYEDYLREVMELPPEKRFFPMIPLEASRGCWWFKCRFCNLNLQWHGFRKKPLPQVVREIEAHARAGFLDFAFMDNSLAPKEARKLFETLASHGRDYQIFAELRACHRREDYLAFARGGLKWVQIGIEALSSSLLKRLNKGTRLMDNVAAMRHCEEAGLVLEANLILEFPGSSPDEVEETLKSLPFVFPFRPLTTVSFWLGYGSPVFRNPRAFGLKRLYPHPYYRYLLPEGVLKRLTPLIWAYEGDRRAQARLWRPVREAVSRWERLWQELKRRHGPLLSYRDGGDFLLIRQVLPDGSILHHRLKGTSREIYLFLTDVRKFEEIVSRFPGLPATSLRSFLEDLRQKRLVFQEGEEFLALAIPRAHRDSV